MSILAFAPLLSIGEKLIDRLIPDEAEKARAQFELVKMASDGDLKQILAQLEVNAKEAQHQSVFVAGWRPWAGWVGGMGFAYAVLLKPILSWVAAINGWPELPPIDTEALFYVLGGMLGLGGLRTLEKIKGATK
jgi:hypothetical protein